MKMTYVVLIRFSCNVSKHNSKTTLAEFISANDCCSSRGLKFYKENFICRQIVHVEQKQFLCNLENQFPANIFCERWRRIANVMLIGPHILPTRLTGALYLEFL